MEFELALGLYTAIGIGCVVYSPFAGRGDKLGWLVIGALVLIAVYVPLVMKG